MSGQLVVTLWAAEVFAAPISLHIDLIYATSSEVLHVLAVAHDRRRPGYWLSRSN